jgi:hypothetical protein
MAVFALTAIPMPPAPAIARNSIDSGKELDQARPIEARPRTIAPIAIGRGPGRRENATASAAIVEPRPDAAIRKP